MCRVMCDMNAPDGRADTYRLNLMMHHLDAVERSIGHGRLWLDRAEKELDRIRAEIVSCAIPLGEGDSHVPGCVQHPSGWHTCRPSTPEPDQPREKFDPFK